VRDVWRGDQRLLSWSKLAAFSLDKAWAGTFITGSPGSGKTTGSARTIAESYLRAGFGGLVMTVKPSEIRLWQEYCGRAGRSKDLILLRPGQGFNFLDHELQRAGSGAGLTENIAELLAIGAEIADSGNGQGRAGQEEGAFWLHARKQACRNAIDGLKLGLGRISVPDLYRFLTSAPKSEAEKKSEEWKANSFCFYCLAQAEQRTRGTPLEDDLNTVCTYVLQELPHLGEKTRSNILATVTAMIDVLHRGIAKDLLCGETTVTPEAMEDGKIVVLALPLIEYGFVGRLIQGIIRYSFQRAMLRRDIRQSPRPVFFWADEVQFFVNSYDRLFLSVAREFRLANVYITQNLPGLYAEMGGEQRASAEVDAIVGQLGTRIVHANGDPQTNEWASAACGRTRQLLASGSSSYLPSDWLSGALGLANGAQTSAGFTEAYEYEVQPTVFSTLRNGGDVNGRNVDAIVIQNGEPFRDTGRPWRKVTFKQQY
jgi:hypothetical protein